MATYSIQNILAPLDLSDASLNAAEAAGAIAQATGAVLHLLYVDEWLQPTYDPALAATTLQRSCNDVLPALTATLETKYQVRVELLMKAGTIIEAILQTAQATAADLIVMGKHGASGTRDGFAGHNTYYTIKYSPVPVLAVPVACSPGLFAHVIYPFRLVAGAQMRHDLVLPLLAPNATVELLSIAQQMLNVGHRALHAFSNQVANKCAGKNVQVQIAQGTSVRIGKELVQYASRNECALVVVNGALDMNGNTRFIGPHTQVAVNGLINPLLFVPLACEQTTRSNDPTASKVNSC